MTDNPKRKLAAIMVTDIVHELGVALTAFKRKPPLRFQRYPLLGKEGRKIPLYQEGWILAKPKDGVCKDYKRIPLFGQIAGIFQ